MACIQERMDQREAVLGGMRGARVGGGRDGGLALEHDDAVGEVGRHDEVVLDDERCFLRVQHEALDDLARDDTLLRVQEPA